MSVPDHSRATGRRIHNQSLILNGQQFVDCLFVNADLRYRGGALPSFDKCRFEGYVNVEIEKGDPGRTLAEQLDIVGYNSGYDLEIALHFNRWDVAGAPFRYHTLLPRSHWGSGQ